MYRECMFSLNLDVDDDVPDDDPPTTGGVGSHHISWSPPALTTTATAAFMTDIATDPNTEGQPGDESITRLAHELDEQASLSDAHPRPFSSRRTVPRNRRPDQLTAGRSYPRTRSAIPTSGGPPAGLLFDTEEPRLPFQRRADDVRPELRSQQNHGLENLLTTMVDYNVQCNVQSPALPEHPTPARRPPYRKVQCLAERGTSRSDGGYSIYCPGLPAFGDLTSLEVDPNYCEEADEALLRDTMALREAGGPAGIRKPPSNLRYRSSADVGAQNRYLRRNLPRMRRRPKTKTGTHAPPAVPVAAGSTT